MATTVAFETFNFYSPSHPAKGDQAVLPTPQAWTRLFALQPCALRSHDGHVVSGKRGILIKDFGKRGILIKEKGEY